MDFTFSAEQDAFRDSTRLVLDALVADGRMQAMVDGDDDAVAAMWAQACQLGWAAILVPEDAGGLGLGLVDAVVALEEHGRVTAPGPLLSSAVCATTAARLLGLDDLLGDLASGATTGAIALEEQGHGDPLERVRTRATRTGGRWLLDGTKGLVLDAPAADWILVAARTPEGLGTFLVEPDVLGTATGSGAGRGASPAPGSTGATVTPIRTLDPSRRAGRLLLDRAPARAVGPDGDHTAIWREVADVTAIALAAELVGVCDAALAHSIDHTGSRVQFDVPLSSHQVIQHKLVDMLHRTELGRVGVHVAAWSFDVGAPDRHQAAAIAKAAMGEAAVAVTGETIQVHGAVGFTWDHPAQLLFKRAKQNDVLAGSAAWHRRRVADHLLSVTP